MPSSYFTNTSSNTISGGGGGSENLSAADLSTVTKAETDQTIAEIGKKLTAVTSKIVTDSEDGQEASQAGLLGALIKQVLQSKY